MDRLGLLAAYVQYTVLSAPLFAHEKIKPMISFLLSKDDRSSMVRKVYWWLAHVNKLFLNKWNIFVRFAASGWNNKMKILG